MSKGLGGIIDCKDKKFPMVITLGQQYHVGDVFSGTAYLLIIITDLRSDAFGPGCHQLATMTAIYAFLCRRPVVVSSSCGSGWWDCQSERI